MVSLLGLRISQALQTCIFTSSSSGEMLALLSTYEVGSFFSTWAQKLAMGMELLFSLTCTPRKPISPSPKMDDLGRGLDKLQAGQTPFWLSWQEGPQKQVRAHSLVPVGTNCAKDDAQRKPRQVNQLKKGARMVSGIAMSSLPS